MSTAPCVVSDGSCFLADVARGREAGSDVDDVVDDDPTDVDDDDDTLAERGGAATVAPPRVSHGLASSSTGGDGIVCRLSACTTALAGRVTACALATDDDDDDAVAEVLLAVVAEDAFAVHASGTAPAAMGDVITVAVEALVALAVATSIVSIASSDTVRVRGDDGKEPEVDTAAVDGVAGKYGDEVEAGDVDPAAGTLKIRAGTTGRRPGDGPVDDPLLLTPSTAAASRDTVH